jgi:hypothetical protein
MNTREWHLDNDSLVLRAMKMSQGLQLPDEEGYSPGPQILATFSFNHWGSNPAVAKNMVDAVEVVAKIGEWRASGARPLALVSDLTERYTENRNNPCGSTPPPTTPLR